MTTITTVICDYIANSAAQSFYKQLKITMKNHLQKVSDSKVGMMKVGKQTHESKVKDN